MLFFGRLQIASPGAFGRMTWFERYEGKNSSWYSTPTTRLKLSKSETEIPIFVHRPLTKEHGDGVEGGGHKRLAIEEIALRVDRDQGHRPEIGPRIICADVCRMGSPAGHSGALRELWHSLRSSEHLGEGPAENA
jgi:hypothetical protein